MTPAIRILQNSKVAFTLHPYEVDAGADSYGAGAAEALGVAPERVFKTLVCSVEGAGLVLALVPAAAKLSLKALASAFGAKKADLADPGVAERATGYVVGGISPLGGRKALPAVVDGSALAHATVFVSAGRRGLQVELRPQDLLELTGAGAAAVATA